MAQHLIDLGHTRIAFLGNARGGKTNAERVDGYRMALQQAGLAFSLGCVVVGPNGQDLEDCA